MSILDYIRILPAAISLVKEIREVVKYVESLFKGKAKGPVKRKLVLDTLKKSLELCRKLNITSENDLNPETVVNIAGEIIDTTVQVFNELGVFKHGTEDEG